MLKQDADIQIGTFTFILYLCFLIDFFLHLSARIPSLGVLRPTLLLVGLITMCLLAQSAKCKAQPKEPVFLAIKALVIYIIVTIPLVEFPGSVLRANLADFVKAVVFFFFTAFIIDTDKRLKILVLLFVSCQVFRVLEPLYLNLTTGYMGSYTYIGGGEFTQRLSGAPTDVINPNELGFVIATVVPFLHYMLFYSGFRYKLLYIILLPMLLYALVLTMSRGAVVGLAVVAWLIFRESKQKAALVAAGLVGLVVLWSIMTPLQKDRYLSLVSSKANSSATVEGRKAGTIKEFKLGFKRPIVGHGVGTVPEVKYHNHGSTQPSHNFYGELLIEIGFVGAFFFFRYMRALYRRFKANTQLLSQYHLDRAHYYSRLNASMVAVFWMYAVYSLNYWGLSQYYWYFFGGLAVAFGRVLSDFTKEKAQSVNEQDSDAVTKVQGQGEVRI